MIFMEEVTVFGGKLGDSKSTYSLSKRIGSGIVDLDQKLNGGFPSGSRIIISGPQSSGKSLFASNMISTIVKSNEMGLYVTLNEQPAEFLENCSTIGSKFLKLQKKGDIILVDDKLGVEDDMFGDEKPLTIDDLISKLPDIILHLYH